ncbi:hypothetical protein SEPCBS119000_003072 [Sporothrix epigloea]|uniref:C2H2-type domain-containing protein n=1 Tax=Sporothrix epigloea TaxID=1892477 RepID=A0ABP0DN47_9PEZI
MTNSSLKVEQSLASRACSPFSSPNILFLGTQPGPGTIHGGQWEAVTEGTQTLADYADHKHFEQDAEDYGSQPARKQPKWTMPSSLTTESVPMRRSESRSSRCSFKMQPSKSSSRPRIQTSLSAPAFAPASPAATVPFYSMAGTQYPYYSSNGIMDTPTSGVSPDQYLAMCGQVLGAAAYGPTEIVSYNADLAMGHQMHAQQHVDPACTQMTMDGYDHFNSMDSLNAVNTINNMNGIYEPSVAALSPQSWGSTSSRRSSPDHGEDTWSLPVIASPTESSDSPVSSPFAIEAASSSKIASTAIGTQRNSVSESDSARDHPLYKTAACQPDGFYHCPWEGDEGCNHKPEKLKCNYDKFVDSHLKPYRCKNSACENARFSSTACLLRHEREAHAMHGHGDKPYLCPHAGCDRAIPGFGFPRQWNLKDHMRRVHHDDGKQLERMVATAAASAAAAETLTVAASSSQAVSKNRKRKKESAPAASAAVKSRTSSIDAEARRQAEALAALEAAREAAIEKKRSQFCRHKDALTSVIMEFTQPDDPAILAQLQAAQEHLDALSRISSDMIMSIQGPQAFSHHSN